MTSMHICLHISLYGYFLIKLQLYFHTTVNLYVNNFRFSPCFFRRSFYQKCIFTSTPHCMGLPLWAKYCLVPVAALSTAKVL